MLAKPSTSCLKVCYSSNDNGSDGELCNQLKYTRRPSKGLKAGCFDKADSLVGMSQSQYDSTP
jgi:hypothetical protein